MSTPADWQSIEELAKEAKLPWKAYGIGHIADAEGGSPCDCKQASDYPEDSAEYIAAAANAAPDMARRLRRIEALAAEYDKRAAYNKAKCAKLDSDSAAWMRAKVASEIYEAAAKELRYALTTSAADAESR